MAAPTEVIDRRETLSRHESATSHAVTRPPSPPEETVTFDGEMVRCGTTALLPLPGPRLRDFHPVIAETVDGHAADMLAHTHPGTPSQVAFTLLSSTDDRFLVSVWDDEQQSWRPAGARFVGRWGHICPDGWFTTGGWLHGQFRGQGHGKRALWMALAVAYETHSVVGVTTATRGDNCAAQGNLAACGFVPDVATAASDDRRNRCTTPLAVYTHWGYPRPPAAGLHDLRKEEQ